MFTRCPQCGEPMEVESTHNGVTPVLHGIHCGWGHAYFAREDCRQTPEAARRELAWSPPSDGGLF